MKPAIDKREKLDDADGPSKRGYEAWKTAKIVRGLEQSRDRWAMIPVEQILRDLAVER